MGFRSFSCIPSCLANCDNNACNAHRCVNEKKKHIFIVEFIVSFSAFNFVKAPDRAQGGKVAEPGTQYVI